jgi:hypothetical protein
MRNSAGAKWSKTTAIATRAVAHQSDTLASLFGEAPVPPGTQPFLVLPYTK